MGTLPHGVCVCVCACGCVCGCVRVWVCVQGLGALIPPQVAQGLPALPFSTLGRFPRSEFLLYYISGPPSRGCCALHGVRLNGKHPVAYLTHLLPVGMRGGDE
jgi:hypothetical protein